jgi:Rieske Fe-S protein
MPRPESPPCADCPLTGRREFLRETLLAVLGAYVTLGVSFGTARSSSGEEHTYPLPAADGAMIDKENQIILVRYEQKVYAFNLSCPHQNTALRWYPEDGQFQCPKHHSRYRPDGVFISGRATRSMDRLGLHRDGANVIVDAAKFYRQDKNAAEWTAAFITL